MQLQVDLTQLSDREQPLAVFLLNRVKFTLKDGTCTAALDIDRAEIASVLGVKPRCVYERVKRLERKLNLSFGRWSNRGRPSRETSQQQRPAA